MSDGMKKGLMGILGCLVVALVVSACSESITNPLTPGSGLTRTDVTIRYTELYPVRDTTYFQRMPMDGLLFTPLTQNLVGRTGNYTAYTAIRFYPIANDTINVLSAKLTLRLLSWRGDSSGTFGFTVHKILASWAQGTATWDSLSSNSFYESGTRGSYSSTVGPDTQDITIDLDTALVRSWYVTGNTSYGILLKPSSSCSIIRGIHAFDVTPDSVMPKLVVRTQGTRSTTIDTLKYQVGADTYGANVSPFNTPTNRLFSHAGIVYRSKLWFDVSKLPAGAIISSATLSLVRDPALSSTSRFTTAPQPVVHAGTSADSSLFESTSSGGTIKAGTSNTYIFDVRRQTQLWVNGSNFGLILRQPDLNEFGTLDVYSFFSKEAADSTLRPRIEVKYTTFN
jgi:hypothetical protein